MISPRKPRKFLSAILLTITTIAFAGDLQTDHNLLPALHWQSTGVLVSPIVDATHKIVSVKDPSVVYFKGRWHIFATTCDTGGAWSMVYLNFTNWGQAATAKQFYLDKNPNLRGYHCAPQVFYFRPQKKWYLMCVSQQPQYSTADDLSKPETWTRPRDFFNGIPKSVVDQAWLDYWVICDEKNAYLFFCGDNGRFYRSQTSLRDFPHGMSDPVIVLQSPERGALFEGPMVYHIKGTHKYLALIEAFESHNARFYKGFIADSLDGNWRPLADTWQNPSPARPMLPSPQA
ncbi:MAG TPA: non-reducing end alpha-L-arabinofuranosidase family hydrolase [Tepidisphaeraceae bacterium]|jgi:hypothetical protein